MKKELNNMILPFFSNLMVELSKKNFICPKPISNKNNKYISVILNKKFMISKFFRRKIKK